MVLLLDGKVLDFSQNEIKALLSDYSCAQEAYKFHDRTKQMIETNNHLIYIHQREIAMIYQLDPAVCFLGTDDATTCHFVVLDCQNAGLIGAAHLDGVSNSEFFDDYIKRIRQTMENRVHKKGILSRKSSEVTGDAENGLDVQNHFEVSVHMAGGFKDDSKSSRVISSEIIKILSETEGINFRLDLCCVTDLNNKIIEGRNFPRQYGMLYNTRIHRMFPAEFTAAAREPLHILRSTRFCSQPVLHTVYDPEEKRLCVRNLDYKGRENHEYYHRLALAPNTILRRYSTSPIQEKAGFEEHMRRVFQLMYDHPDPRAFCSRGEKSIKFKCCPKTGEWIRVN